MKTNPLLILASLSLLTAGCAIPESDYDRYRMQEWGNSASNTAAQPNIAFATGSKTSIVYSERLTTAIDPLPARPHVVRQASLAPAILTTAIP
jgi:hypothetical protein